MDTGCVFRIFKYTILMSKLAIQNAIFRILLDVKQNVKKWRFNKFGISKDVARGIYSSIKI